MSIADKYRMERGLPPRDNPEDIWKLKLRKLKRRGTPNESPNYISSFWNSVRGKPSAQTVKKLEEAIFIRHTIGLAYRTRRVDGINRLVEMVLGEEHIVSILAWMKAKNFRFIDEGGHIAQTGLMTPSTEEQIDCVYYVLFKRKVPCDRRIIGLELYHFGLSFEQIKELGKKIGVEHPPAPSDRRPLTEYLVQMIREGYQLDQDRELLQACIYGCGFSQAQTDGIAQEVIGLAGVTKS